MTQDEFIAAHNAAWAELDALLVRAQGRRVAKLSGDDIARVASLYRALAGDLARARSRHFSGELVAFLEQLAARAHSTLYAAPPWRFTRVLHFIAFAFPVTLRKHARYVALAALLFAVPLLAGLVGALLSAGFAERILPASALQQAAEGYSRGFSAGRGSGEGALMTGFYVYNNVGIAFRCFATGIFFGLGSAFFLLYNGLTIGTVLGYVVHVGYGRNIASFIVGHAPFELTAIVIAGAAGLRMGDALVNARGQTRLGSLRAAGSDILALVLGAAGMLLVAALIEGLWSGSSIPMPVKWSAGAVTATLVAVYLRFAGRAASSESP